MTIAMTLAILVLLRAAIPLNTQLMLQMFQRVQFLIYLLQVIFRILEKTLIQKMAYHLFFKTRGVRMREPLVLEKQQYTQLVMILIHQQLLELVKFYVKAVADSQGQTANEQDFSDNGDDNDGNTDGESL